MTFRNRQVRVVSNKPSWSQLMMNHRLKWLLLVTSVGATSPRAVRSNPQLCGVNSEWINPLGVFVSPHYSGSGRPAGWLPPNVSKWVNLTAPLHSGPLHSLLDSLGLGIYRYPGGSIGNWWDWRNETFVPSAQGFNAQCDAVMRAGFAPHAFGVQAFDSMVRAAGAEAVFTLDVSSPGTSGDVGIPQLVAERLDRPGGLRFEIGNEVYDPRQGPPCANGTIGCGFATAQDYMAATSELIRAAHALPGGRVGVTAAPCPFFYPEGSACWGGVEGRYHKWNANLSKLCSEAADGESRCDAVVAHDYPQPFSLAAIADEHLLSAYLAIPGVTIDFGVASLRREYPAGTKLWVTEFNTMYAQVWKGGADAPSAACPACRPSVARFFNLTANSGAHAVHVVGYLLAAMAHGDAVELMNYHSFLEGAGPGDLGPGGDGAGSQPGFAVAAINATASYISPVAQLLSLVSGWLREEGSLMEGVALPAAAASLPFDLSAAGFGPVALPCVQASAICSAASRRVLAVNRCAQPSEVPIEASCGGGQAGWASLAVYNASLAEPGRMWAELEAGQRPSGPLPASHRPAGAGASVAIDPFALTVITLDAGS